MMVDLSEQDLVIIQEALGALIHEYSQPSESGEPWDEEESLEYWSTFNKITEAMDLGPDSDVG